MPHIVIEYSDNLTSQIKESKVTAIAHTAVVDSGLFSPEAVKARSVSYGDYVLPDGAKNFIHVTVSILAGRGEQERQSLSASVFAAVKQAVSDVDKLSVNIHEMCKETYSK